MMTFWWLALKDLLITVRDKKALLTLILMPLLLIAILGSAFGDMLKEGGDVKVEKFTLGIVNLDDGQFGKILSETIFKQELADKIKVEFYQEQALNKRIKDHKLDVGIIIGEDFSTSLMSGDETKVQLLSVPDPGIKGIIVTSVIEQFAQSIPIESMAVQSVQAGTGQELSSIQPINQTLLHETTVNAKTKPVTSFQYYAAGMGVMFLLMTVVQGAATMILEKEQEVYKRLLLSNLTYTHYLFGKMLGLLLICLAQAYIIIIGTKLLFGVEWGASVLGVIIMTFAFVVNACGLGMVAVSFIKSEKSFNVAGMLGTQIFAALGGSMAPLYIFPDWAVTASKFLPNGLALQTYLDLMSGATFTDVIPEIVTSILSGLLFICIGLFRLSLERRRKYA